MVDICTDHYLADEGKSNAQKRNPIVLDAFELASSVLDTRPLELVFFIVAPSFNAKSIPHQPNWSGPQITIRVLVFHPLVTTI